MTLIYVHSAERYSIASRGSISNIELITSLWRMSIDLKRDYRSIDLRKRTSTIAFFKIDGDDISCDTGALPAENVAKCLQTICTRLN